MPLQIVFKLCQILEEKSKTLHQKVDALITELNAAKAVAGVKENAEVQSQLDALLQADIQAAGCHVIQQLVIANNKVVRGSPLVSETVIQVLMDALNAPHQFSSSRNVQVTASSEHSVRSTLCRLLEESALLRFKLACSAIARLVVYDDAVRSLLLKSNQCVSGIVKVLELQHGTSDSYLQLSGCAVIANLCVTNDETLIEEVVRQGGLKAVLFVLENPDIASNVREVAWRALVNMSRDSDVVREELLKSVEMPMIRLLRSMRTPKSGLSENLQDSGCRMIGNFTKSTQVHVRKQLIDIDAFEAVCSSLIAFPKSQGMQLAASHVLRVTRHDDIRNAVLKTDLVRLVVKGMKESPGESKIQGRGCAGIRRLCDTTDERIVKSVIAQGGLDAVFSAVRNPVVQGAAREHAAAWDALAYMSKLDVVRRAVLDPKSGPVFALLTKVMLNPKSEDLRIHRRGCYLISNLAASANHGIQKQLMELKAVEAVCTSMNFFPASLELQRKACSALALFVHFPDGKSRLMSCGAQSLVSAAKSRFGSDPGLNAAADKILKALSEE